MHSFSTRQASLTSLSFIKDANFSFTSSYTAVYLVVLIWLRIVLTGKSVFFRNLLVESGYASREYELTIPDPQNLIPDVLRFLYTGEIETTRETISGLLDLAERLRIVSLKVVCELKASWGLNCFYRKL